MSSGGSGSFKSRRLAWFVPEILDRLEAVHGRTRFIARFSPMEELISCILSQHTADTHSFPAFTRFRSEFPDWGAAEAAGPLRIADSIRKAGLVNQKSKSVIAVLRAVRERAGDYSLDFLRELPMPEAKAWLRSLPGVGPKTAAIVLSLAFGRPAIPVDTHVFRVSRRLGFLPEGVAEGPAHEVLEALVAPGDAHRFHSLLIQHGRHVCRAPIPLCGACTITDVCPYFKAGGPEKARRELAGRRNARRS
jgi:endonuclease-3